MLTMSGRWHDNIMNATKPPEEWQVLQTILVYKMLQENEGILATPQVLGLDPLYLQGII